MRALVSAILPVFNGEATLQRALESALDQDFEGLEIVAVNDGSTDSTSDILERYSGRILVVTQSNRGLAAARNAGIRAASGEFLALLDADDVWLDHKLEKTIDALRRSPQAALAYSDATPVDSRGDPISTTSIPGDQAHSPSMDDLLHRWWPILPSTVVLRRSFIDRGGGFAEEFRQAYEDLDMWLRMRELGSFEFIPETLVLYRTTPVQDRMSKYEGDYRVFASRIRQRYGDRASPLLKSTRHAYVSALGYKGVLELRAGNRVAARKALARALRYDVSNIRNILRLLRTLLPARAGQMLSGRSPTTSEKPD